MKFVFSVFSSQPNMKILLDIGVDSGDRIQVAEVGNNGRRGVNPGNLFIKLEVSYNLLFLFPLKEKKKKE